MLRSGDWLAQAERDLEHARHSVELGDYEWACFAAQQAAEKAVKALVLHLGGQPWGHSVTRLAESVAERCEVSEELLDAARRLDRHYILPRYPNGFDRGHPAMYYSRSDGEAAVRDAEGILEFCRRHLARQAGQD